MKWLVSVILALMPFSALASDFNSPTKAAAPYYNWTGFYIGANGGYGVSNNPFAINAANTNAAFLTGSGAVPASLKTDQMGAFGGGQAGYNQQFGAWVVGIETDFQYGNIKGSDSHALAVAPFSLTTIASTSTDYWGTTRARFGFAGFERTLIYATGGLAYGHVISQSSVNLSGPAPIVGSAMGTDDAFKLGYALGGGVEYAIMKNLSIKAEALYVNLGNSNSTMGATVAKTPFLFNESQKLEYGIARGGVNYHF